MAHVEEIKANIAAHGREALFFNVNAADDGNRADVPGGTAHAVRRQAKETGRAPYVRVLMHSLAFGTLKPFLGPDADRSITARTWT